MAIDGPAGSGKSTTAKLVAKRLGYTYLDTGAMYRALTYYALRNNISPADESALAALARKLLIEFVKGNDIDRVLINKEDVTTQIRSPEITSHVSEVSAHKAVRQAMVEKQKSIGEKSSIVAEGRDTTTVVFPDADVKVYMDAFVDERAHRRLLDMTRMGIKSDLNEQKQDLQRRDKYDSQRKHSPLVRASDAVVIDTTRLTIDEQVERIIELVYNLAK